MSGVSSYKVDDRRQPDDDLPDWKTIILLTASAIFEVRPWANYFGYSK